MMIADSAMERASSAILYIVFNLILLVLSSINVSQAGNDHIEERGAERFHSGRSFIDDHQLLRRPEEVNCEQSPLSPLDPFYTRDSPNRSNIRDARQGIPLDFGIQIIHVYNCEPIVNASVNVWHCDSKGIYSGFSMQQIKQCSVGGHCEPRDSQRFLRGYQFTDEQGWANFSTIIPGWAPYRTMHINVLVMLSGRDVYAGEIYFEEKVDELVASNKPYSISRILRVSNTKDHHYLKYNGSSNVMNLTGGVRGLKGSIVLGIEPSLGR
ncbi:uncharacterized protein LOC141858694 [Brevipalpus obovatus]|uniref:uncharacterized protein LOC141858694 n=1 Tax=Brevipalpus obovatus TaxID=246614 RepID=UPI003D9E0275